MACLRRVHTANGRAVNAAYVCKGDKSDPARVVFLFDLYGKLTSLLLAEKPKVERYDELVDRTTAHAWRPAIARGAVALG